MPKFAPRSVKVPLDDKAARLGATVLTFLATNDMYIKKQKQHNENEKNIPTAQQKEKQQAWFPSAHADG